MSESGPPVHVPDPGASAAAAEIALNVTRLTEGDEDTSSEEQSEIDHGTEDATQHQQ